MRKFILETVERALKTAAQSAIATFGTSKLISDIDWKLCLSAITAATILSVLTSIASINITKCSASLIKTNEEVRKE